MDRLKEFIEKNKTSFEVSSHSTSELEKMASSLFEKAQKVEPQIKTKSRFSVVSKTWRRVAAVVVIAMTLGSVFLWNSPQQTMPLGSDDLMAQYQTERDALVEAIYSKATMDSLMVESLIASATMNDFPPDALIPAQANEQTRQEAITQYNHNRLEALRYLAQNIN